MALSQGTQQWHPSMAPTSNGTQQWHRAMAPCPIRQSGSSPAPPIGSKNAYSYRYLGKYQINMVSRSDTAGQFLQTVVLQVETAEASEIPKKTFWKCSQAIALQMKFAQATEIPKKTFWKRSQFVALQRQKQIPMLQAIEHSSGKLSQIHVCQIQGAVPVTSTAYTRCSDAINR